MTSSDTKYCKQISLNAHKVKLMIHMSVCCDYHFQCFSYPALADVMNIRKNTYLVLGSFCADVKVVVCQWDKM